VAVSAVVFTKFLIETIDA